MKSFNYWYSEDDSYNKESRIDFCKSDKNHTVKLSELLALTSDTAIDDYFQRGFSWDFLAKQGFAILLSRLSFRFFRMPKCDEYITIHTWEEAPQGLQLFRAYDVLDKNGETLISGISSWLVVNPETRRILKPSQFTLRELPKITKERKCLDCGKITIPENLELLEERKVRFSDLDGNGHVNNSRYGDYVIDSIPEEYQNKCFTDFRLNYAHEAVLGENLSIYGAVNDQEKRIVIVAKQKDSVCFESELYF